MSFFDKIKEGVTSLTQSDKKQVNKPPDNKNKMAASVQVVVETPKAVKTATSTGPVAEKEKKEEKGFFDKIMEDHDEKKEEEKILKAYEYIDRADVEAIRNMFSKQDRPDPNLEVESKMHSLLLTASLLSTKGNDEALQQKYLDIMEILTDAGANVTTSDDNGFEALHAASSHNAPRLIQKLIDKKANVNTRFTISALTKNFRNFTPLHWSCHQANTFPEIIQLLIKNNGDVNQAAIINDAGGWTPINISASQKDWKIVKTLIENNADPNKSAMNAPKTAEWNSLHFAVNEGNKEMVDYLLQKGCDINAKGKNDESPLLIAASKGNWELAHHLIEKKSDVNVVLNDDKKSKCTALHYAIMSGQPENVQKLLKAGADTEISGYWKKDESSYNQESFSTWEFALETKNKDIIKLMLDNGYRLPNSTNWIWDGIRAFKGFESEWTQMESNDTGPEVTIKILAISGKNLAAKDVHVMKSSDPYVRIYTIDPKKQGKKALVKLWQSQTIDRNLNPVWIDKPEKAATISKVKSSRPLVFVLFDKDLTSKDDFLGTCTIHLAPLVYFGVKKFSTTLRFSEYNPLNNKKEEVSGTMDVTFEIIY